VRIALDSSVLIAAHISRAGVCAELLDDVLLHHDLVISEFILDEVCRKLIEKFSFPKREADQVAAFLRRAGTLALPAELPTDLCRDPTDIPILGTAVAGECALLISVDRDLLDMRDVLGIPIIRPGDYWRRTREIE
jgi:putative PIN family toxin of toxin-antitoxin system